MNQTRQKFQPETFKNLKNEENNKIDTKVQQLSFTSKVTICDY